MPQQLPLTMTPKSWVLLILLSVLWGGSFFFVGVAVDELPPFTIVACRLLIAALILNLVILFSGKRQPGSSTFWMTCLIMGIMNNVIPFSLIVWGQGYIPSGLASVLNATTPLFTTLVAHFLISQERMTIHSVIGVLLAFAGVIMMIGQDVLQGIGINSLAQLAVLTAAVSYAFAGVWGKRFHKLGVSPLSASAGQLTTSAIIMLPVMFISDKPWTLPMPSTDTMLALFALAALSTALAFILYFKVLAIAGATNASMVTFLIPISAILLGITLLDETLSTTQLSGMALIAAGLVARDGRPGRYIKRLAFSRK